jgi:hypothetical protein
MPTNLIKGKKKTKASLRSHAKSIKAAQTASKMQPGQRRRKLQPASAASPTKAAAAMDTLKLGKPAPPPARAHAPDIGSTSKRVAAAAEQRRLARQGFVPGIAFAGEVDMGESVRQAREELLMESHREMRRQHAHRTKTSVDPKAAAWGGVRPGAQGARPSSTGAVPRPPAVQRAGSAGRLATRPHSARETISAAKMPHSGFRRHRPLGAV